MANFLTVELSNLITAALADETPGVIEAVRSIEAAAANLAKQVAAATGVTAGSARFSGGEFVIAFHENNEGQRLPGMLRDLDPECAWATSDRAVVAEVKPTSDAVFYRSVFEVESITRVPPASDPATLTRLIMHEPGTTEVRLLGTEGIDPRTTAAIMTEMAAPHEWFEIDGFGRQAQGSKE